MTVLARGPSARESVSQSNLIAKWHLVTGLLGLARLLDLARAMPDDEAITDRIELLRAQPPERFACRPDLENVGGALRLGVTSHGRTDNPDRSAAAGVFRVHQAGTLLEIVECGAVYEDERRRNGAASFARHVFALNATQVSRAGEFLHQRPEKSVALGVQWVFCMATHNAADMSAPAAFLNPQTPQFTEGAVMEHVLARTVVQKVLLAGNLRGKQRRRLDPCTLNGAIEADGPIKSLQQLHIFASELAHQPGLCNQFGNFALDAMFDLTGLFG